MPPLPTPMAFRSLRALLGMAALYGAAFGAAFVFLSWYRHWPPGTSVRLTAAAVAVPLAVALGFMTGSLRYFEEARLLRAAIGGAARLEDGRRVVAMGPIEALGPVLKSPFTRRNCVAYQYRIERDVREADRGITVVRDYWGIALTPCQIMTAAGPVRLLGYARLEQKADEPTGEAYRAAADFLHATTFRHPGAPDERQEPRAEPESTESNSFLDDVCADGEHLHTRRDSERDLRHRRLVERRLEVGATVCAVGLYSADKLALVPTRWGVKNMRITTQGPEKWADETGSWGRAYIRWGVFFLLLAAAAALATRWVSF